MPPWFVLSWLPYVVEGVVGAHGEDGKTCVGLSKWAKVANGGGDSVGHMVCFLFSMYWSYHRSRVCVICAICALGC